MLCAGCWVLCAGGSLLGVGGSLLGAGGSLLDVWCWVLTTGCWGLGAAYFITCFMDLAEGFMTLHDAVKFIPRIFHN